MKAHENLRYLVKTCENCMRTGRVNYLTSLIFCCKQLQALQKLHCESFGSRLQIKHLRCLSRAQRYFQLSIAEFQNLLKLTQIFLSFLYDIKKYITTNKYNFAV